MNTNPLRARLDGLAIEAISVKLGYKKRSDATLTLSSLIEGFMNAHVKGQYSLEAWAMEISLILGENIDKQGIQAKFHDRHLAAVKAVMEAALSKRLQEGLQKQTAQCRKWKLFESFKRVLIEDSTCQTVDSSLAETFPTTNGGNGVISATMRIQAIYDLVSEAFAFFDVTSFRENDQKAASNMLDIAQKGDLVLRDRGYWSLAVLAKMIKDGIFWLSLWQPLVSIIAVDSKQKIDLLALLKQSRSNVVDMKVLLGVKEKLPVRLVAIRLPENIAAEKRRKARLLAKKSKNHSDEYYELLGWNIFVTNIEAEVWTSEQISYAYRVRWRIETIFKCWKSIFKLKEFALHTRVVPHRVYMSVYIMLLLYALIFNTVFNYFNEAIVKHHAQLGLPPETCPKLSMLKMAALTMQFFHQMLQADDWHSLVPRFYKFATYQKDSYRANFETFIH